MKTKVESPEKLNPGQLRPERPWLECAGELAHLHKETVRINKLLQGEFGQLEGEDGT